MDFKVSWRLPHGVGQGHPELGVLVAPELKFLACKVYSTLSQEAWEGNKQAA
jgi:hypothetical protein